MTEEIQKPRTYTVTRADKRAFFFIMLPALVEGVVTQLFGMIDTLMLGNTADSAVNISAVSIANAPFSFAVCVLSAFTIGTTTAIAWFTGRGERENVAAAARQSMLAVFLLATAGAALALLFADPIVSFAGARGELHAPAASYFRIVAAGLPFEMLCAAATAAMRGIGVTKIAMTYNLISGAANVCLNYCLIYGHFFFPEMGVRGAALATTLSKLIAFCIAMYYMLAVDSPVRIRFSESFRFTRNVLGRVAAVGSTTAMEQVILQGGNILATRVISQMDTVSIAAYNVCNSIQGIAWRPGGACQVATTAFTGRDLGEGRPEKARARCMMVLRYALIMCAAVTVFTLLFRFPIARLFSPVEEIWRRAGHALVLDALSTVGVTVHLTLSGSLRAAGDQKYPLIASLVSLWVFRVLLSFVFLRCGVLSVMTARVCVASDQLVRGLIVALRFFTTDKWRPREKP